MVFNTFIWCQVGGGRWAVLAGAPCWTAVPSSALQRMHAVLALTWLPPLCAAPPLCYTLCPRALHTPIRCST
jgi:hypothetical protein